MYVLHLIPGDITRIPIVFFFPDETGYNIGGSFNCINLEGLGGTDLLGTSRSKEERRASFESAV